MTCGPRQRPGRASGARAQRKPHRTARRPVHLMTVLQRPSSEDRDEAGVTRNSRGGVNCGGKGPGESGRQNFCILIGWVGDTQREPHVRAQNYHQRGTCPHLLTYAVIKTTSSYHSRDLCHTQPLPRPVPELPRRGPGGSDCPRTPAHECLMPNPEHHQPPTGPAATGPWSRSYNHSVIHSEMDPTA